MSTPLLERFLKVADAVHKVIAHGIGLAGERPGYGGGFSVGYRVSLTRSKRLNLEFAVGAGVYYLHYDTFYNVPNGKYVSTHEKTYFGPDQASITLSYQFTTPNARRR